MRFRFTRRQVLALLAGQSALAASLTVDSSTLLSAGGSVPEDSDPKATIPKGFGITAAEANAGFTAATLNAIHPVGNVLRYRIVPNSPAAATANTTIAKALFSPAVTNGPMGQFTFPNTTGKDIYYFNGVLPMRDSVHLDLQECTLNFTGTATSADTCSGFLFCLHDFEVKNGNIVVVWATDSRVSSSGYAIKLGARGTDSSYFTVWDSLRPVSLGNFKISNIRINSTITGAAAGPGSGAGAIAICGGVSGLVMEDISINGNGTLPFGIVSEFGWATKGGGVTNLRQTSHAHNIRCTNINVQDMDNTNTASAAVQFTGAYDVVVDGLHVSHCSNGFVANVGEAMFWRPSADVDGTGGRRTITVLNATIQDFLNSGITVDGTYTRAANSSYTQPAWRANTPYSNGGGAASNSGQTVVNGGNMFVCAKSGTSGASGGPTGIGTGIVDGGVTWDYVPLTANTDLYDCVIENFAISGGGASGNGIVINAGNAQVGVGTVTGCRAGIVIEEECTQFEIDQVKLLNNQNAGINGAFTASAIWHPARLKKGSVKNSFIAGNSQSGAGKFGGMTIQNYDSVVVENNRFGYDTSDDSVAETTQAQAIFIALPNNCSNLIARNNRVAVASGSAYVNINRARANGNTIEGATGNTTSTGAWDVARL
jgi:hypothetical protein